MTTDWLTAASFEHAHEVVSAINTISIDAKLRQAGMQSPISPVEVEQARQRLVSFLDACERLVSSSRGEGRTVVGADPWLSHLALRLLEPEPSQPWPAEAGSPASAGQSPGVEAVRELHNLVDARRAEDLPQLVSLLGELRALMEEIGYTDSVTILGEP